MSSRLFFLVLSDFLSRCVDVSRPDRLSSAEITSVVQAAGLQGVNGALHSSTVDLSNFTAVRKNRYVILPIDFEEAWKVSNVVESIRTHVLIIIIIKFPLSTTSKRSRGATRRMNSVSKQLC